MEEFLVWLNLRGWTHPDPDSYWDYARRPSLRQGEKRVEKELFTNLRKGFEESADTSVSVRFKLNFLTIGIPGCIVI
jgi:hypothetical protein